MAQEPFQLTTNPKPPVWLSRWRKAEAYWNEVERLLAEAKQVQHNWVEAKRAVKSSNARGVREALDNLETMDAERKRLSQALKDLTETG